MPLTVQKRILWSLVVRYIRSSCCHNEQVTATPPQAMSLAAGSLGKRDAETCTSTSSVFSSAAGQCSPTPTILSALCSLQFSRSHLAPPPQALRTSKLAQLCDRACVSRSLVHLRCMCALVHTDCVSDPRSELPPRPPSPVSSFLDLQTPPPPSHSGQHSGI